MDTNAVEHLSTINEDSVLSETMDNSELDKDSSLSPSSEPNDQSGQGNEEQTEAAAPSTHEEETTLRDQDTAESPTPDALGGTNTAENSPEADPSQISVQFRRTKCHSISAISRSSPPTEQVPPSPIESYLTHNSNPYLRSESGCLSVTLDTPHVDDSPANPETKESPSVNAHSNDQCGDPALSEASATPPTSDVDVPPKENPVESTKEDSADHPSPEEIAKREEKSKIIRREVIKEICNVEQVYNSNLCVLLEVYLQPIQNIQPSPLIDALLKDILDIQQPHNILLNDLITSTGCKENFPNDKLDTAPIGKIFSDISPYLKIYLKYMSNHSQVGAFLAHASKKLSNYLNECINKPECQQRDFDSYSTMPIQQIPRYEMLIKRLIENTPETHPDLPYLQKALKEIRNVANKCNQGLADECDSNITRKIHASLGQLKDLPPSRKLIKHGNLKKKNHYGKIEYCTFFLWNDCLMYANRSTSTIIYQTGKYRNTINFTPGITCRGSTHDPLMFYIQGWTKNVILIADTIEEHDDWIEAIDSVIDKVNENYTKGKRNEFYLSKTEIQSIIKSITDKTPEELFGQDYEQGEIGRIIKTQMDAGGIRKEYKHLQELENKMKKEEEEWNTEEPPPQKILSLMDDIQRVQASLIHSLKLDNYITQTTFLPKEMETLTPSDYEKLKSHQHHRHSFAISSLSSSIASSCAKCDTKFGVLNRPYNCPCCNRNYCSNCFSKNPKLTSKRFERDLTNRCANCIVQYMEFSKSNIKSSLNSQLSESSLGQSANDNDGKSSVNPQDDTFLNDHVGLIIPHTFNNTASHMEDATPISPH